jgi:MerR family regulatory protein
MPANQLLTTAFDDKRFRTVSALDLRSLPRATAYGRPTITAQQAEFGGAPLLLDRCRYHPTTLGIRLPVPLLGVPTVQDDQLFNTSDAAALTGVSVATIIRYERDGIVSPFRRDSRGNRLFSKKDVEDIIKQAEVRAKRISRPRRRLVHVVSSFMG